MIVAQTNKLISPNNSGFLVATLAMGNLALDVLELGFFGAV